MNLQHRSLNLSLLVVIASLLLLPAICSAQLVPPGDFQGKSLDDWGFDYIQWAIKNGLGGQMLPDTVDGVRYLPTDFGVGDFVADLAIQHGTPLARAPFFVFGERYDNGTEDNPNDPILDAIFQDTTVKVSVDGTIVLEGLASAFPDRKFGVTAFPAPISFTEPQPRGPGLNSIAALFGVGITTIYDNLPLGMHTIRDEFNSPNFFGARAFTYNVNVVPEPASALLMVFGGAGLPLMTGRRARWSRA